MSIEYDKEERDFMRLLAIIVFFCIGMVFSIAAVLIIVSILYVGGM